jgi:inorganic pyrophosphatase
MELDNTFWQAMDALIRDHNLVIDRPRDSAHPHHEPLGYPLDYGYLEGTSSADGGGIDVWAGSLSDGRVMGIIFTVDLAKADAEVKVLLACTPKEARMALAMHNQGQQKGLLVLRPSG